MRIREIYLLVCLLAFMPLFSLCSNNDESTPEAPQQTYSDLSYGGSASQKMDLIFPKMPDKIIEPINAILFIHGGGWQNGDKNDYKSAAVTISEGMGFLAASMNYRMFGDGANCNDMLADINAALNLMKAKAAQFNVTINKVVLMGASAGGHLALLYSYKNYQTSPIPIAFCVGQCALSDFTDPNMYTDLGLGILYCASKLTGQTITNFEQNTALLLSISPIHYVTTGVPPTLLAHGALDEEVPFSNSTRLYDALRDAGITTDLYIYPNSGHALANDPVVNQAFYNKMQAYISVYMTL